LLYDVVIEEITQALGVLGDDRDQSRATRFCKSLSRTSENTIDHKRDGGMVSRVCSNKKNAN